jgi:hypothetical protein
MLTLYQRYYPYQPTTRLISTHRDRPDLSVSSCGLVLAASRRTRRHAAIPLWKLISMNLDFALPFKMTGRVLILPCLIQFASLDTPIGNPEADVLPSEQEREMVGVHSFQHSESSLCWISSLIGLVGNLQSFADSCSHTQTRTRFFQTLYF